MKMQKMSEKDSSAAYKFSKLYGCDKSLSYFKNKYKIYPDLFVVCHKGKKLIGICWGFPRGKGVILIHIAIDGAYWKKGIGKKLLRFWERQAKKLGKKKISLGAATKPTNVVGFYVNSGYKIVKEKPKFIVMEKKI